MAFSVRRRFTFRGDSRTATPFPLPNQSDASRPHHPPEISHSYCNLYARRDTQHLATLPHQRFVPTPAGRPVRPLLSPSPEIDAEPQHVTYVDPIARVDADTDVEADPTRRFSLPAYSPILRPQISTRPQSLKPAQNSHAGTRDYARFNAHPWEQNECDAIQHRKSEPMLESVNGPFFNTHAPADPKRVSMRTRARTRYRKSDRLWWTPRSPTRTRAARSSSSSPSVSQHQPGSFFKAPLRDDSAYSRSHSPRARSSRASLSRFARPFGKVRALWPFHSSNGTSRSHRARPAAPPTTNVDDTLSPPLNRPSSCRARRPAWPRRHPRVPTASPADVCTEQISKPVPPSVEQKSSVAYNTPQMDDRSTDLPTLCPINSVSRSGHLMPVLDDRPQANPLRRLSFHGGRAHGRAHAPTSDRASEPDPLVPPQPRFPSLSSSNAIGNGGARSLPSRALTPTETDPLIADESKGDINRELVEVNEAVDAAVFIKRDPSAQTQKEEETALSAKQADLDVSPPPSLHSASESCTQSGTFSLTNSQSLSLSLSRQSSLLDALLGSQPRLSRRALRRHDLAMRMRMATCYQTSFSYPYGEYYHAPLMSVEPTMKDNLGSVMQQLRSPATPHGIPWSPPRRLQTHVIQPHVCIWPAPTVTLPSATTNAVPIPLPIALGVPVSTGLSTQDLTRVRSPVERVRRYMESCEWSETSTEYSESQAREKRAGRDLVGDASYNQENFLASRIFAHKGRNEVTQLDSFAHVDSCPPMTILPPAIAPMPISPPVSSDARSDAPSPATSRSMDDVFYDASCNTTVRMGPTPTE